MTSSAIVPPGPDEAEISVFGPGIGECIVVHLGQGRWIVVDSCLDQREPVALRYLRQIGVAPAAISDLVVTHWHNDHIRGASAILDAATNARTVFSAALNCTEFKKMLKAWTPEVHGDSGLEEVQGLLQTCARRRKGSPARGDTLIWALEGLQLVRTDNAAVHVLSPSHHTKTRAFQELGQYVPEVGPKLRPVAQGPNNLAIALWIEIGAMKALLGSDLACTRTIGTGWVAVVTSSLRPSGLACVFKVAHHGSAGADEPAVWTSMLTPGCVAVTTPFNALKDPIPRESDLQRILSRTSRAYLTSAPGGKRSRRSPDVSKLVRQMTGDLREIPRNMGHVRVRCPPGGEPNVELFDGAFQAQAAS